MIKNPEAKPCPFCGGEPSVHPTTRTIHVYTKFLVICEKCLTGAVPLSIWNKRVWLNNEASTTGRISTSKQNESNRPKSR